MRNLLPWLFGLLVLFSSHPTKAQGPEPQGPERPGDVANDETDARARQHFMVGRNYFEEAQYEEAAREFQRAFDLSGRHELLLNLALAHERALQYPQARETLRLFLERAPADDERRSSIMSRITRLEEIEARAAERHRSEGSAEEETSEEESVPAPVVTSGGGLGGTKIAAIAVGGAGAAAGIASLITGLMASSVQGDLEEDCASDGGCPPEREDDISSGSSLADVSTVLTGVAIVGLGVGAALWFMAGDGDEEPPATVGATVGPEGGLVDVRVRF